MKSKLDWLLDGFLDTQIMNFKVYEEQFIKYIKYMHEYFEKLKIPWYSIMKGSFSLTHKRESDQGKL